MKKAKLKMKERNIDLHIPPGWGPTHREIVDEMRAIGDKTWYKQRHFKKDWQEGRVPRDVIRYV